MSKPPGSLFGSYSGSGNSPFRRQTYAKKQNIKTNATSRTEQADLDIIHLLSLEAELKKKHNLYFFLSSGWNKLKAEIFKSFQEIKLWLKQPVIDSKHNQQPSTTLEDEKA